MSNEAAFVLVAPRTEARLAGLICLLAMCVTTGLQPRRTNQQGEIDGVSRVLWALTSLGTAGLVSA